MSRWLDRVAVRLAESRDDDGRLLTRRETARLAAGSALAVAAASTLGPLAEPAGAESYCFNQCDNDALDRLHAKMATQKAFAVSLLSPAIGGFNGLSLGLWAQLLGQAHANYLYDLGQCSDPNCGDPVRYPKPPGGGAGGGGGGVGGQPPPRNAGCPDNTFACTGRTPTQCCAPGDVCCSCGLCCTFVQYCDGCCMAG